MIQILQTALTDTLNVEERITEVLETVRNTPTEVLVGDLLDKIVNFGLKVIAAIILYTIGVWLIRRIKRMLARIFEKKKTDSAIASFVQSIASIALTIILIISIVGTLGIDTTSLAALLAGGGMAIGMALNGTVQNFAGGIMILIFRPFKAGDYIEAQGYGGTVSEVNITSTKLTTICRSIEPIFSAALHATPLTTLSLSCIVLYGFYIFEVCFAPRANIPSRYESKPKPIIEPTARGAISDTWRNSSRARIDEICTSTTGVETAPTASASATAVWV